MATASAESPSVWASYFEEMGRFLDELGQQCGICNRGYTEHALSRLEQWTRHACAANTKHMFTFHPLGI